MPYNGPVLQCVAQGAQRPFAGSPWRGRPGSLCRENRNLSEPARPRAGLPSNNLHVDSANRNRIHHPFPHLPRYHTPVRRRLIILVLFLLAGAVVNIAVAWGCAATYWNWEYCASRNLSGAEAKKFCCRRTSTASIFPESSFEGYEQTFLGLRMTHATGGPEHPRNILPANGKAYLFHIYFYLARDRAKR